MRASTVVALPNMVCAYLQNRYELLRKALVEVNPYLQITQILPSKEQFDNGSRLYAVHQLMQRFDS